MREARRNKLALIESISITIITLLTAITILAI